MMALLPVAGVEAVAWRRGEPMPGADVYWLTVRDEAIAAVGALVPPGAVALHAAGSLRADALPTDERGRLHPLMTFPGPEHGLPALAGASAAVEGTPRALDAARALAQRLGMRPIQVDGDVRTYHAAACLASGHLATLFLQACRVLASAGVREPAAALLPLAHASLERAAAAGPVAITGPAARGDRATVAGHVEVLSGEDAATYRALAEAMQGLIRAGR
jgi:predicted short-subunit dehydrogenase-like oxidoreductase (DUF2520 family)